MLQTLLNGNPLVLSRAEMVAMDAQSEMNFKMNKRETSFYTLKVCNKFI